MAVVAIKGILSADYFGEALKGTPGITKRNLDAISHLRRLSKLHFPRRDKSAISSQMKAAGEIKYVLSDLDGVIRHFPKEHVLAVEEKFGLPAGSLHAAAFKKELLTQAICGFITDEAWRSEIAAELSRFVGHGNALLAVKEWTEIPEIIDHRFLDHLSSQLPTLPIALLTNATTRLGLDLKKLQLHTRFCAIFNTSEMGFCKPDPRVFLHVCERLRCSPNEIFFIDDALLNVEAARACGLHAHHYVSFHEFKANLLDNF